MEQLRKQQRVEKGEQAQGDSTRRESGFEDDWNMEVEEEVDNKKKVDERRKRLQKQLREIDKFSDLDEMLRDAQKERWKEELQDIEKKRNKLLSEHQNMQKRSPKLQSLQDKKRNCFKDACACEEEMRKLSEEMEERQARFLALSEKSGNCRMAADDLEEEIKDLQAGEKRQLCVAVKWMLL